LTKYRNQSLEKRLWRGARQRALRKNLDFDLDVSDILIPKHCPILDIELKPSERVSNPGSPAIDRIDNSKGYIKTNIAVISHKANSHKADLTLEQLEKLLKYMKRELN